MFNRYTFRIPLCFVILSCLASQTSAELLTFTSLPVVKDNKLPHTTFHSSDEGNGTGGAILGWANLTPGTVSTYDPVTGALDLYLTIYTTQGHALANEPDPEKSPAVGTAHGVSSNLVGSNFGQFDGQIIGSIDWEFNADVAARFVENPNKKLLTQQFVDFNYVTTDANFTANTWDGKNLTLWGANGTYLGANFEGGGKFETSTTSLGFDFVGVTNGTPVIPEPSSMLLLLMGTTCLGGAGFWKRRRRDAQLSAPN